jgi:hypothetical protein
MREIRRQLHHSLTILLLCVVGIMCDSRDEEEFSNLEVSALSC